MALPSFLTSVFAKKPAPAAASHASLDAGEIAREARTQARRRLIGASVLLGAGIIGFPLLFENRPRPIPVDIPIEIPAREGVPALAAPVARADARRPEAQPAQPIDEPAPGAASAVEPKPAASAGTGMLAKAAAVVAAGTAAVVGKPADKASAVAASAPASAAAKPAAKALPPAKPATPASKPAEAKPAPKPEAKPAPKPDPKPAAKPEAKPDPKATKPVAADDGRYVVQIGAFAEVGSAREARMKVEGMGLKTYTQVIESATGRRIRVRVGPYATKAEADKAAARIKSGGLQAAVLVL